MSGDPELMRQPMNAEDRFEQLSTLAQLRPGRRRPDEPRCAFEVPTRERSIAGPEPQQQIVVCRPAPVGSDALDSWRLEHTDVLIGAVAIHRRERVAELAHRRR